MKILITILFTLIFTFCAFAQDTRPVDNLHTFSKIYIGEMGKSDEAERFRMLLSDELGKNNFKVVERTEDADAVLSGILTVRNDDSSARATVILKSTAGERLWGGDFEPKFKIGRISDYVKFRAENIADKLRKDWDRSAKKAGMKVK